MTEENFKYDKEQAKFHDYDPKIETEDLWIVPYADFMTVLMIFFLMMFAFAFSMKEEFKFKEIVSKIQTDMGGKANTQLIQRMIDEEKTQQIVSKFDEMIEKLNLKNYVTVNTNAEHIKIVFSNPILFDIGETRLKDESKEVLRQLKGIIFNNTNNEIIVEGHTDNLPISGGKYKSNWELSIARSMEVVDFFIKEGLDPKRLAAAGYGEFRPVLPNDSESNMAQNRRIEIDVQLSNVR